ncbi:MAG TPA: polysaccharide deacetylase family protein [Thermodesulfovibrionales bacterium]|nr:polysaccharide deacetylase family protein [Thermodesulfovibrionales bacterium]
MGYYSIIEEGIGKVLLHTATLRSSSSIALALVALFLWLTTAKGEIKNMKADPARVQVPILLYHRFAPVVADGMTVTTAVFESHLTYLRDNGYTVLPLRQLVDYYLRKGPPPPSRSVVIVADDGHKSVYTDMYPLVRKYHIPVTLFIYPSAISNASYAMTWDQLRELKKSGLFDFQSHTYWHPNFRKDRKKFSPSEYERSVEMQLRKSKEKLEKELGGKVDMLAWPFGLYDEELMGKASACGYVAAFTIERHHTSASDNPMSLPRYLMINADKGRAFEAILQGRAPQRKIIY